MGRQERGVNQTQFAFANSSPGYDGATYVEALDHGRLKTSHDRIYELMRDGRWRTLRQIAVGGKCSEAAASARMRDFRKARFREFYGVRGMESQRQSGSWLYRLVTE